MTQLRRGACPGLSAPMQTGDGLLVRTRAGGPIPRAASRALRAARRHGNGTIEVTARGSLQVRGLTRPGAAFCGRGRGAGDRALRVPVIAEPLAGDPAALVDAAALAAALRRAIAGAATSLAPKVSVVVDGGGRLDLDAVAADIRLRAPRPAKGRFQVALGGDAATATRRDRAATTRSMSCCVL